MSTPPIPLPPPTPERPEVETLHGDEVVDPYRWLEDQDSPETRAWIEAQIAYTRTVLGNGPERDCIRARLTELLRVDAVGMPTERGGRYFFFRRSAEQDQPVLYCRTDLDGPDRVLLDPNTMRADHTVSVSLMSLTADGTKLAWGLREGGADEVTVSLLDVATGEITADVLPSGRYFSVLLPPDCRGAYYSIGTDDGPRVRYHALDGTDGAPDRELFGGQYGPQEIIGLELSEAGDRLLITVYHGSAGDQTELYLHDTATGETRALVNDVVARFEAELADGRIFVKTDWEAPRGRILEADPAKPAAQWREVIAEPEGGGVLTGFAAVGGRLIVEYLEQVRSRLAVHGSDGRHERDVPLPTLGSVGGISGRWSSVEAFFSFSSFALPNTVYRYDVESGAETVWARTNVPVDSDAIAVHQVWYASKDGTRVPMFLVHRAALERDGNRPVYLTAYGGFNASLTPYFSAIAALWAEAGGVFAAPNLRGGGEFGEAWHAAGMREKKQNAFDDFTAAAEWLIANGYTNPNRLAIAGGSNGGLLVGAALTQRPDLFRAVVCQVPLLDMLRYHRFLVARYWVPEYGSAEDPAMYPVLMAYSPYHHVRPGVEYPAVLFMTGDSDTRVAPLHARKMCALLQRDTGSRDRPILLHYDTKAGHSGGLPLTKQIEDATDQVLFVAEQLGMRDEG